MLPESPVPARHKKAGLIFGAVTSCGFGVFSLLTGPPTRLPAILALAFVVIADAGIVIYAWPATDGFLVRARRQHGRPVRNGGPGGRGLSARGLDGEAGHVPGVAAGRLALRAAAWLMPRAAGRRWRAEAESVLFEMPAGWRGRAVRSYLRSAPRLAMMLWTRRLMRRFGRRA
jgi:hypothetical protein